MRDAGYSLREVQRMLSVSRSVVERLIAAGFVTPSAGERRERRFSFRDVVILRTAHALRVAGVSPMKIVRALDHLQKSWSRDGSLTSVRIAAVGDRVAVRDDTSRQWDAESGQLLLDFEPKPACGNVASLERPRLEKTRSSAEDLFYEARDLEGENPEAAETMYREALLLAPDYINASLNLGCILVETERFNDAITVYKAALRYQPDDATLHFNIGVALEDSGQLRDALDSYQECIRRSPNFADAHFNAARIHEELGEATKAIRHFNRYRNLQK
ncbi:MULTISPECIES: tetratricopeptide repeat protein [Caballeronia]|uniref:tetratricopeptide repeat protein n=1 Tax=Caballeronia TaxID=1827195 RepID=UPI001FD43219|nr:MULTISPECIES: tetratricopeptide repeat protein [Caballeronia]MDR5799003.1 tetratricopeptide repeat protein [Caballeronia sp. LZ001]